MLRAPPLAILLSIWATAAASEEVVEPCNRELLVSLHRRLGPAVDTISAVHFNYTSDRHYEVVEVVSVFHVDRLCRSALHYVETLRLAVAFLVCPDIFSFACSETKTTLQKHLDRFFADLRFLAAGGEELELPPEDSAWSIAAQEMQDVTSTLGNWVQASCVSAGQRLTTGAFNTLDEVLGRVLAMVRDFVESLADDVAMLFRTPNYISKEMHPAREQPQSSSLTASVFENTPAGVTLRPEFMKALQQPSSMLTLPSISPYLSECRTNPAEASVPLVPLEYVDQPASWAHHDVSGALQRRPSPLQILNALSHHTRLSNLFISVQLSPYLFAPDPQCGSRLILYDPSLCLRDHGWGGYNFELNPLPPFNLSVLYTGKPLGPGKSVPKTDVHSIHVPSMDTQWSSLVSTFKSMNHHSPDMLFISPLAGSCQIIDRLLGTGTIRPKVIYLPVNPLLPPPTEKVPDFFEWWGGEGELLLRQLGGAQIDEGGLQAMPITASAWLAQCSLESTARKMQKHGYNLLHLEHTFAVFLWSRWDHVMRPGSRDGDVDLHRAWLTGWHCSPHAPYLFDLEALVGALGREPTEDRHAGARQGTLSAGQAKELAAGMVAETPTMRYFVERSRDGLPQRGRCAEGVCECFPPFRGQLCEQQEGPRKPQRLRAVIHYITAETEQDLSDLQRSLSTLWQRFNQHHDYPIVIFHDGLSPAARRRIIHASDNRVWLVTLPRFREIPQEWAGTAELVAKDFPVGYRAMTRWRSGPVFQEPALAGFDYAMTLDTDSYFPADLVADPFEFLDENGLVAAFPHLGRESASVVVNFLHHFLLYCRLQGLHPRRTKMLASLIESNFKWYQQCLMLDIEVLRLDWFRQGQGQYQDMFQYMDATGGFWLHRWGNNPFRTFAVGLLLEDSAVRALSLPYAHQDYCSCGPGAAACTWDAQPGHFVCPEVPAGIEASDLATGLLDLQPWRGTARQRSLYEPQEMTRFLEEQGPLR